MYVLAHHTMTGLLEVFEGRDPLFHAQHLAHELAHICWINDELTKKEMVQNA